MNIVGFNKHSLKINLVLELKLVNYVPIYSFFLIAKPAKSPLLGKIEKIKFFTFFTFFGRDA